MMERAEACSVRLHDLSRTGYIYELLIHCCRYAGSALALHSQMIGSEGEGSYSCVLGPTSSPLEAPRSGPRRAPGGSLQTWYPE